MTPESLLTMTGDVLICVRAKDKYDVLDLVRAKKIASGILPYHADYDFNNDGVVDDNDVNFLRRYILLN